MRNIIAITNCERFLSKRFGLDKCLGSFSFFHPDIPIYNWGDEETNKIKKEWPGFDFTSFMPIVMLEAKKKYNADLVIKLDADSIILGRLDEILNVDYEIASCRNNDDGHTGDEKQNRPQELWGLPNTEYVSCGCLATTSEEFLNEWRELNKRVIETYGGVTAFWMCEQNTMNVLFHCGKYKTKILDQTGTNLYYGASANMYSKGQSKFIQTEKDPAHIIKEWGINSWQSWREMTYDNGEFWLYGRKVKILHQAGGGSAKTAIKLSFDMFDPSIVPILQKITKCEK